MSERRCPECDAIQKKKYAKSCWKCSADFTEFMEKNYPALRVLAGIYEIIAWIGGAGALVAFFYSIGTIDSVILIFINFIIAALIIVSLLASAELIKLFVNIANHVRVIKENSNK
ncbi:MAG: hypothetical protein QF923_01575 [Candidatus Marinimicrobia bacterium]|jgi:uncharacterized protein (DUF983 family)|nr:hypothetical protein [Candidatus Neomarinimicrobiota bacterium]